VVSYKGEHNEMLGGANVSRRRDKLVALRLERGWSQEDVAKQLRVTTSFYGMIEQGVRTPRLALALAMESLFGVPVSELFLKCNQTKCWEEATKPPQPLKLLNQIVS